MLIFGVFGFVVFEVATGVPLIAGRTCKIWGSSSGLKTTIDEWCVGFPFFKQQTPRQHLPGTFSMLKNRLAMVAHISDVNLSACHPKPCSRILKGAGVDQPVAADGFQLLLRKSFGSSRVHCPRFKFQMHLQSEAAAASLLFEHWGQWGWCAATKMEKENALPHCECY